MKFGVIVFPGSNCDHDAYHVISKHVGQPVDFIWHRDTDLSSYDAVIIPGGFSYGDYLRAGALARFSPVMNSVKKFARGGRFVLGICNGFQILCEAGLLPGALIRNRDLHFICEHVNVRVETTDSPFTNELQKGSVLRLPIAHAEGNYVCDEATLAELQREDRIVFRYCDANGQITADANPNGSLDNIAGICSRERNVLGLMPHPERACEDLLGSCDGSNIFRSLAATLAAVAWRLFNLLMKRLLPFAIIILVLGVAVGSAYYLKKSSSTPPANPSDPSPANQPSTAGTSPATPAANNVATGATPSHKLGPDSAPVKLEEFGDFECPPCGQLHPILEQMHTEFGDQLQIIFREFPLSGLHKHAITAASAAEAAGMQGKFWEMHDLIYEHQAEWKEQFDVWPIFEGYAKQIGLNIDKYKADLNGSAVATRLFEDGRRGRALGVEGTPTVFLNGRELPFASLPADKLRVIIRNEISKR